MDENQVVFQCEEDAVISHAQSEFSRAPEQFFDVAAQAILKRIEALANPAALLPRKNAQLAQRLVANLEPKDHPSIMGEKIEQVAQLIGLK